MKNDNRILLEPLPQPAPAEACEEERMVRCRPRRPFPLRVMGMIGSRRLAHVCTLSILTVAFRAASLLAAAAIGAQRQPRAAGAAVALVLALAALLSGAGGLAHAQPVYVSNTGQRLRSPGVEIISAGRSHGQQFTTGYREGGHPFGSVQVGINHVWHNGMAKVTINESRHDRPGREIYVLTSPDRLQRGLNTFTAPAGATLSSETKYFIVVAWKTNGMFRLERTGSNREDEVVTTGWSIANSSRDNRHYINVGWRYWNSKLQIAVRGVRQRIAGEQRSNTDPVVANEIQDQFVTVGAEFSLPLAADTFTDADGDVLTYTAKQADGTALPAWLAFAEGTRTFSGTPQADDAGTVSVKVTANDGDDGTAEDTFDITVVAIRSSSTDPTAVDATVTTTEEAALPFRASHFGFSDDPTLDTAGHVKIVTLPTAGALTVNGEAAVTDQIVQKPLLDAGALVFTPAANGYGDAYATFDFKVSDGSTESTEAATMTIAVTGENDPVAGRPSLAGTPEVVETVTAVTTDVSDADGTANATYTYRWFRVKQSRETTITGAEDAAYTIDGDDKDHQLRVEVSFTDDGGTREVVTSNLWPANGTIRGASGGVVATFPKDKPGQRPASHDGTQPFTVELHFTERPDTLSFMTVGTKLLETTNAVTESARRLRPGNNRYWRITVRPTAAADIVLRLPVRQCAAPHGICTDDGRQLAAAVEVTIPYADPDQTPKQSEDQEPQQPEPLTVKRLDGPAEHAGAGTTFRVELEFSEAPRMSYKTVKTLLRITGGTFRRAWRDAPPSNLRYNVTIAPSGDAAVQIDTNLTHLAACGQAGQICTSDGRALQGAFSEKVHGPVAIRVEDAMVQEAAGAMLAFKVKLDRARHAPVSVNYATQDRTATAGLDYTADSGTLTFDPDETEKTVSVEVLEDAHNDDGEFMVLTLSNPSAGRIVRGEATGTITNSDPLQQAWLARFGRTVGSQVLEAVSARLDGSPRRSHLTLGGVSLGGSAPLADPLAPQDQLLAHVAQGANAHRPEELTLTGRDLLLNSSFHLVSDAQDNGGVALSAWGRVSTAGFQAEVDEVALRGDVTSGLLGFDAEWERLLAGLVLARSEGDGTYDQHGGDRGALESSLTGLFPYARLRLGSRVSAWGLAGVGSGDLTLIRKNEVIDTGLAMRLGAMGVRGALLSGSALNLAVMSDAMWVHTESDAAAGLSKASAQVSRVRLILEGGRAIILSSGALLTPTVQVALRHDGGDAETGTGVEVGAGLAYSAGLLTVDVQVRTLLAHDSAGYEEWGASGAIRLSPDASSLGPSLAVLPSWGALGSGVTTLWSHPEASSLVRAGPAASLSGRLDAEVGYGLRALHGRGVLTPFARSAWTEDGGRNWHLGTRLALAESLNLSLEGSRLRQDAGDTALQLMLRATTPW